MRVLFFAFACTTLLHNAETTATMDLSGRINPSDTDTPTTEDAYDEDVIVNLITEIYKVLLKLGPMDNSTMAWPPPEGHQLKLSTLPANVSIDPPVLSLMKRLPVNRTDGDGIVPSMVPVGLLTPFACPKA